MLHAKLWEGFCQTNLESSSKVYMPTGKYTKSSCSKQPWTEVDVGKAGVEQIRVFRLSVEDFCNVAPAYNGISQRVLLGVDGHADDLTVLLLLSDLPESPRSYSLFDMSRL